MSISDLQQNLTNKGYDVGVIDGKLGALTFQALAEYVSGNVAPAGVGGLIALDSPGVLAQPLDFIHFFAQVSYESGFKPQEENLNYSAEGLRATFGPNRITDAQCQQFGRTAQHPADKQGIANTVYGGPWGLKNLGNTQPGDGYLFRGRGLIQMTGRANYASLGSAYVINPDLLLTPSGSIKAAMEFWAMRKINIPAEADNVQAVTQLVNGGLNGLPDRIALTNRIKAIWPL